MNIKNVFIIGLICWFAAGCSVTEQPLQWTADQASKTQVAVDAISPIQLATTLTNLDGIRSAQISNSSNHIAIYQTYLTNRMKQLGLTVSFQPVKYIFYADAYSARKTTNIMNNLIGVKTGSDPSLAPVLITAHWDTVTSSKGLNDDGSGCAVVLEAARVMSNMTLKRTVIYILFSYEELGLVGAYEYAAKMTVYPKAIVNMDCVGYTAATQPTYPLMGMPTTGDYLFVGAIDNSTSLAKDYIKAAAVFSPDLKFYMLSGDLGMFNNPLLINLTRSDQTPFWEKNVPGLFLTDMANFRGTYYHTMKDTLSIIDYVFLTKVAKATIATTILEAMN